LKIATYVKICSKVLEEYYFIILEERYFIHNFKTARKINLLTIYPLLPSPELLWKPVPRTAPFAEQN